MGGMPLDCSLAESGLKISASRKKKKKYMCTYRMGRIRRGKRRCEILETADRRQSAQALAPWHPRGGERERD